MPIQTLSGTVSRLIFQFRRPIMCPTPMPRPISLRWSFSLNPSLRKYPTHSVTHRNHEQKTFASRTIQRFPIEIVASYVHIQWLTRGLSFASTPSPCLYADDLLDSFVGIAAAQLLPRASITSKNRISLRPFYGVTHISIRASEDTTLPSHFYTLKGKELTLVHR